MVTKREKRILEREEGLPKGKRLKSGANDTTTKEEEKEKVDKKMSSSSQKIVLTSTKESPSGSSLDSEVQKRRQRMLAWRQQRQLKQQQLHDSRGGTNGTHSAFGADDDANSRRPGANAASNLWSLEDEDDDGGEHEEEEEGNPSKSGDPSRMENEEDEIDPLDAFMAAEVLPEVERLKKLADDDAERIETKQSNKTGTTTTSDGGVHSKKTSSTDEITQGEHEDGDGDGDEDGEGNERNMAEASKKSSGDGEPNTAKERRKTLINLKAESKTQKSKTKTSSSGSEVKSHRKKKVKYFYDSESSDWSSEEERESEDDEEWAKNVVSGKGSKLEKLIIVDHSKIDYIKFRKNFFIESPEITKMSPQEVTAYRKVLDNIKVRGKNVPKPIKGWHQCGLSTRILQVIQALDFEKPTPIQCQALPIIMQGRDCIGIAKTGSGKTMAFVLPMLRHINDQPYLKPGEGPIGIIMAPTRELVQQIGKDIKKFAKNVNLRLVCVYGGSGVADQIAALKRGAEIVVCTPGRLIDILAMGAGNRITNMRRVTYMVLDEADRMFDMGFEPQIKRILNMVRPDRQTVMFSATFPKQVETLARLALTKPVEILVGGRSIVNLDIEQIIEVRPEEQRFLRLLELLGHWYERGKVLVFVKSQERCDNLFRDLLKAGYPCMSLHGGKDQSDRECTINDFKSDVCNVLVATSVAARGLDVKDLQLVVNYDVPNHHEDYVHRVGRTGRAGKKGTAVTFIAPDEEKYAPDLVKALKESGKPVPYALQDMADDFTSKLKQGLVQGHGSGFGGSGFKFDEEEDKKQKMQRKRIQAQYGTVEEESGSDQSDPEDDSDDDIRMTHAQKPPQQPPQPPTTQPGAVQEAGEGEKSKMAGNSDQAKSVVAKTTHNESSGTPSNQQQEEDPRKKILLEAARKVISNIEREAGFVAGANPTDAASRAAIFAAKLVAAQQGGLDGTAALALASAAANSAAIALAASGTGAMTGNANNHNNNNPHANHDAEVAEHYNTEIEINDFPQLARWKVSNKEAIFRMSSEYNVAITAKGIYVPPNKAPKSGERKLYLLIEGPMERGVKLCKTEIKKIIQEYTEKTLMSGSRYQI